MTIKNSNLGYPRIGEKREWKKTLESFWKGDITEQQFEEQMKQIRLSHLQKQLDKGIDLIQIGDFSYYDHILDTAVLFGLLPERFWKQDADSLQTYFDIARGSRDQVAAEMTKWFNTNYHYLVPELGQAEPRLTKNRLLNLYHEAKEELGINGKPVLVGPLTLIALSKGENKDQVLQKLIPLYVQVLQELADAGAEWIQIDEPLFVTSDADDALFLKAKEIYGTIKRETVNTKLLIQTYFESVEQYDHLVSLPVDGIGLDFVYDSGKSLQKLQTAGFPRDKVLAAGVIDGRNVWKANLQKTVKLVNTILEAVDRDRLILQPSCSLIHVPVTAENEKKLDPLVKGALSFADEKLEELSLLTKFFNFEAEEGALKEYDSAADQLSTSKLRNQSAVHDAMKQLDSFSTVRPEAGLRRKLQNKRFSLPLLPTTTIGSFPQTKEVRAQRLKWKKGELTEQQYTAYIEEEIKKWIDIQESLELDVLVHGEFERTDMVEFFGDKLTGIAITTFGWVQSYGSRCVRPPVIYGDVLLEEAMTVKESVFAQSLSEKPVKGMLTGPVTILNWSFVRNDLPKSTVLHQLSLSIRKEVQALEQAGIAMIQVDEPALREGLPLKSEKWNEYLADAVTAFKRSTASVQPDTQIHTHMCYSNFEDIIEAIDALDADVISIETSRSHGELIHSFEKYSYEKGIGLGVYDIHSPRIPTKDELVLNIERALQVLDPELFWVNPDCGLKTRGVSETVEALKVMVAAAKSCREKARQETSV
ncbi:5-methyltetrahydropteroyltriglutamate--homocysteine S-methyltransferase [Peribacillus frigoritolerans]|uniref:5-methyltetrahydropteroyltriglutamate-- homocysteine S-methyltransferase n=1 Tax=Peribacillus frigoritolerans TaxID=450367 RepID=UPI0010595635|nr:5-methyltetrahydropteroyltriglutamate--homocysteine S-methyltransferase [Peribacillus frigoritolerans]TDL83056.1 5-methyltetrahydropteroyltriglutamate--homocysteine S-methyltransferase [Peribacillus frigoritolerans]